MTPELSRAPVPNIILDTNVALDWLVFRDAKAKPLAAAITAGQVRLLSCVGARAELRHMLGHASLSGWGVDADVALALHDHHAILLHDPPLGAAVRLRCTDPDDQVFIDLALAQRPASLLTHDRALLKLARRARIHGVQVLRPRDWPPPVVSGAALPAAAAVPPPTGL